MGKEEEERWAPARAEHKLSPGRQYPIHRLVDAHMYTRFSEDDLACTQVLGNMYVLTQKSEF